MNPLLAPSDLPYGLPRYDRISVEHYLPAIEAGLTAQRREVEAIVADPQAPSFENTLVALERSGQLLERASAVFFNAASADTSPEIQEIEAHVSPLLAAHADAIWLDRGLYTRVAALYDRRDQLSLDPESARLLERYHTRFVRAGARLSPAGQEQLRELNQELAALTTEFARRLLADTNDLAVLVKDGSELAGLGEDAIAAAAVAARTHGHDSGYLLRLALPTSQPLLASLADRRLRERIHRAASTRGARGNENDTSELVLRIVALRARRARLLGYAHHAHWVIEDNTAGTVDAVNGMLDRLAAAAVRRAAAEAADLQRHIRATGETFALEPWDWAYYAERVRIERHALDADELRAYFELERVLHDGVFFAAGRLYGLRFVERPELPAYHPDARVFEVLEEDGAPLGLFIADFHTRDGKHGGAWANSLASQSTLLGSAPVVCNNLNLARPPAGEPTLLTLMEVTTIFHEFGHALHALLSAVRYPTFAGTSVPSDYVEFPSQVNEMWALWPEVLANYARHHVTGAPLPEHVVERLLASRTFNQGFETSEMLAAALLDLAWHTVSDDAAPTGGVERFEAEALARAGVALHEVPPRYHSTYFRHVFAGGYSAGYYSYVWSEILDADTAEWFAANGGLRRENGRAFQALLANGDSVDPMTAYRDFHGREPRIEPLLERRGLTAQE